MSTEQEAKLRDAVETLAGLVWVAKRNGLDRDPYVIRARRILDDEASRAALVGDPVPDRPIAFSAHFPAPPAGADEPEADPPQAVAADPSIVDAESDTVYGDAMREHERQSWLRRVQAQPIR